MQHRVALSCNKTKCWPKTLCWFDFFVADIFKTEKRDEVVYYDTYESMEAMLEKEDPATSVHLQKEELQKLQQKIRQLEARRGRISAKKAYLRNKKVLISCKFLSLLANLIKLQNYISKDYFTLNSASTSQKFSGLYLLYVKSCFRM